MMFLFYARSFLHQEMLPHLHANSFHLYASLFLHHSRSFLHHAMLPHLHARQFLHHVMLSHLYARSFLCHAMLPRLYANGFLLDAMGGFGGDCSKIGKKQGLQKNFVFLTCNSPDNLRDDWQDAMQQQMEQDKLFVHCLGYHRVHGKL